MLKGHAFNKTKVINWPQCMKACNDDIRCQSVNYVIGEGMCELNKRTKEAKPEDYVPASDVAYMTRFSERAPLGSIPELPVEFCDEIIASEGENAVSGKHWFDSIKPGKVIQAPCICMEEGCTNYQTLTGGDRKITAPNVLACDNSLGPGWFRFLGDAGTKMPTSCVPTEHCGTDAPGWLNGTHPTVAEGKVTRQVCFNWRNNCCTWTINIQVRNCGDFFVYCFNGTPPEHQCHLRYCGTD
ncbi:uromodulin-like [Oculina patagonica]